MVVYGLLFTYIRHLHLLLYRIEAIECTQLQEPLDSSEEIKTWNENNSLRYLTHRLINTLSVRAQWLDNVCGRVH